MKNVDILTASQALAQLAQEKLPIGTGIKIRRLTRQVSDAAGDIDEERKALLEKHAKRDDAGAMVFVDEAKTQISVAPEFGQDWQALLNMDADIIIDRPLRPQDLNGIQIAPALLLGLGDLLTDEDPPA